ncbi:MAG: antitoxin Xre/MbcA/ParS toxin-binding domain-containing protein [Gammaproteobacteria bacterium]
MSTDPSIEGSRLILRTNSEKRCKKGQALLERYLKDDICFQKTVIESIESMMKKSSKKGMNRESNQDDFRSSPEVQQQLKKMIKQHWEKWFDEPIPALDHQTPRQAAKTEKGRELLEALLLHYESSNSKQPDNLLKVDLSHIKA